MKSEVGRVYYFTTRLVFPRDKDEWVKQRHIPASTTQGIFFFISGLDIDIDHKRKLCRDLECSWKNPDGIWVQLVIETTRRNKVWGPNHSKIRPKLITRA